MNRFVETSPTDDAYWRSIVLFGKNSASYKFALMNWGHDPLK